MREGLTPSASLRQLLSQLSPGPVPPELQHRVKDLLSYCWPGFAGHDQTRLRPHRLLQAEDLTWEPPYLCFAIERHGATMLGSSRAEIEYWHVDLDREEAILAGQSWRQLYPRRPPWNAKPVAEELAQAILQGREHPALTWQGPNTVRVRTKEVIPDYDRSPRRTLGGRQSRLWREMEARLGPHGWKRLPFSSKFVREPTPASSGEPSPDGQG